MDARFRGHDGRVRAILGIAHVTVGFPSAGHLERMAHPPYPLRCRRRKIKRSGVPGNWYAVRSRFSKYRS